jgi:DNA modification methylase
MTAPDDVIAGRARWCVVEGDSAEVLRDLPAASVQCCVTSPPYWGLRDYGDERQIGQESTPEEYVARLVEVFREVRRVLRDDGVLWLNLGDSYTSGGRDSRAPDSKDSKGGRENESRPPTPSGLKPKDLVGIPWMVAFALRADGWYLRSEVIWSKPNPMPESVTDRPTKAHEQVFLLTKSSRYFYDAKAIAEPTKGVGLSWEKRKALGEGSRRGFAQNGISNIGTGTERNARSVWEITPEPCALAHFATMPPELARRCILAGSRKGGIVIDPFGGAATTALMALAHGRRAILCEINPDYIALQHERLAAVDTNTSAPIAAPRADFGPLFGGGTQ